MWTELLTTHGYWLLAIGCLLEGETLLLLAGFAARLGHLDPSLVFLIGATCGFAGDQLFFWLGRRHGVWLLRRFPRLARRSEGVRLLLLRWDAAAIVAARFAYGLRIAGPVLMGVLDVSPRRFALFNAIGALLWAALVGGAGWLFGEVAARVLGELHVVEEWLLGVLVVLALASWAASWWQALAKRAQ